MAEQSTAVSIFDHDLRQNISQRIALPKLGRDATWCKVCGKFCYNDLLEKFDYTCQYCGCFLKGRKPAGPGGGAPQPADAHHGSGTSDVEKAALERIIAKGGAAAEQAKLLRETLVNQIPAAAPSKPASVRLTEATQKVERAEASMDKVAKRVLRLEQELGEAMEFYRDCASNLADAIVAQELVAKELAPAPPSSPSELGKLDVRQFLDQKAELNLSFGGLFDDVDLEDSDREEFERRKSNFETEFRAALDSQFRKVAENLASQQQKKAKEDPVMQLAL
ncbi:unnamed protein product, partial [Prorocentrum cordatum]